MLIQLGSLLVFVEQEGDREGREHGRVDDEKQDDPVPHRLERRVVQDDELLAELLHDVVRGGSCGAIGETRRFAIFFTSSLLTNKNKFSSFSFFTSSNFSIRISYRF